MASVNSDTFIQPRVTDAIELRGGNGEHQPCKVVMIDENLVHCEAA
jgi:hypothetical protein